MDPLTLYRVLWLRVGVFVVEQEAAYPEIDGRDIEPGAELMWAQADGDVVSTLRVLAEPDAMRIGRVATAASARGRGVAAELMRRAVARCEERAPGLPIVLDAQAQLEGWYARFGFAVAGAPFSEDGIPHLPMRRG
ncbi:GNAT family N-acetyltransferase [Microbacterium hatanonis]|uniref:GNAT family N-acetyltransferase n=2 Tax=Microbacterium hatanonis TaxID=404366 RepID=A0A5C8I689_9MICO|nr:GNAT family N-acetyltransferase [Microbacterium hatanonis]